MNLPFLYFKSPKTSNNILINWQKVNRVPWLKNHSKPHSVSTTKLEPTKKVIPTPLPSPVLSWEKTQRNQTQKNRSLNFAKSLWKASALTKTDVNLLMALINSEQIMITIQSIKPRNVEASKIVTFVFMEIAAILSMRLGNRKTKKILLFVVKRTLI